MEENISDLTERPEAPLRTETFRKSRPEIVGEGTPQSPFPIRLEGSIQHGHRRGGRELGCPTGKHSHIAHLSHLFIPMAYSQSPRRLS